MLQKPGFQSRNWVSRRLFEPRRGLIGATSDPPSHQRGPTMLRTCVLGLFVVSVAVAGFATWRTASSAQPPKAIPLRSDEAPPPVNGKALKPANPLPMTQVVLFNSGVGYFQREGPVEGEARVELL